MQHQLSWWRRVLTLLITVTLMLGMISVMGSESVSAAAKLKVSPASKTIYEGSRVKLKANKKVKWSVVGKKKNIKIVSKTAKTATIKGVKAGTVYVKAKAGKKYKKVKIVVRSKVPTKINLVSSSRTVGVKDHCTVYVKSVSPSYASKDVTFSSSDTSVATVTKGGLVTGVSSGDVTITAKSKLNGARKGSVKITVVATLSGMAQLTADFSNEDKYPKGEAVRVWLPVPQTDENQTVPQSPLKWSADKAKVAELTTDSNGNKALYVEWDENTEPSDRVATLKFYVTRRAIVRPDNMASYEKGTVDKAAMAEYLKETKRSGSLTSGIVKETSDQIVQNAGAKTVYQKAYAIYDWICENLTRDGSTPGIGAADVVYILNHYKSEGVGRCADVNAVFVALCKAQGIPARTVYGLQMDSVMTGAKRVQKCKAQYYLPGYGWAEADVSAPLRAILNNEDLYRGSDAPKAEAWKLIKDEKWGNGSESWVMVSEGSDIELSPRQSATTAEDPILYEDGSLKYNGMINDDGTLNYFVYPYAEYAGKALSTEATATADDAAVTYSFTKDEENCGC